MKLKGTDVKERRDENEDARGHNRLSPSRDLQSRAFLVELTLIQPEPHHSPSCCERTDEMNERTK